MPRSGIKLVILLTMFVIAFSGIKVHAEESDKPYWYPEDVTQFEFYHDEYELRVVDNADIFTDEEEYEMEMRIEELREALQRDIVVFTDVSTYGLERSVYAADFYDFNGYGYGDEREGFCLFICMDPNDRGFWICSTGTVSRQLHSERNASLMNDRLLEFMQNAEYAPGVSDWIENIAVLYRKGAMFAPDWFPDQDSGFERFRDPNASRVIDECGFFTESETSALKERISRISAEHGVDIVIHTLIYPSINIYDNEEMFYKVYGYGLGDSYDGIMLTLAKTEYYYYETMHCTGDRMGYFYGPLYSRLFDNIAGCLDKGGTYDAAVRFLDDIEHYLKTGRIPKTAKAWLKDAGIALLIGCVVGGIMLLSASRKMKSPTVMRDAYGYLNGDTVKVLPLADEYVGTKVTRTYRPVSRGSTSSDDSSSYESSYSGSSGAEHTGSGSDF